MKYIKQLDSLRAIAVFLVIFSHWVTIRSINKFINNSDIGAIGADIFFVLSGFLITRILFDSRNKAEVIQIPISTVIKNFYIRRTLRIFPIYYFTIILLFYFQANTGTNIKTAFLYFVTYTSNFYFFNIQHWDGIISHLWSLAVEEQFYLIWPWVILFIRKKYFLPVIMVFIFLGIISQLLLKDVPLNYVLTFTCFDAFGLGALLAWQVTYRQASIKMFYKRATVISCFAVIMLLIGLLQGQWRYIPLRTIVAILSVWMIAYILVNEGKETVIFKYLLNNKVLIFIGKISYGIYMYHNIVPYMLNIQIIDKYFNPLLPDLILKKYWTSLYLFENSVLLILISWASYVFIEKKFLKFKEHYRYQTS